MQAPLSFLWMSVRNVTAKVRKCEKKRGENVCGRRGERGGGERDVRWRKKTHLKQFEKLCHNKKRGTRKYKWNEERGEIKHKKKNSSDIHHFLKKLSRSRTGFFFFLYFVSFCLLSCVFFLPLLSRCFVIFALICGSKQRCTQNRSNTAITTKKIKSNCLRKLINRQRCYRFRMPCLLPSSKVFDIVDP